jgi:RNA polymerase sigma factor (TIGR02999 family)
MRCGIILVDQARKRAAAKRGGGEANLSLEDAVVFRERPSDLVALDDALQELEKADPRRSRMVELKYFGGLTAEEIGELVGVSPATVQRDLRADAAD